MKSIVLDIDLVNEDRTFGRAETAEKVTRNLKHFPKALEGILQHKIQRKEDTIATWPAGRWLVYYLYELDKNEESIYFFDINFNFDDLKNWPINSINSLKYLQSIYKPKFTPDKDLFELAKYDCTVLN